MSEQLSWPVAEIPQHDPEVQYGENYFKAKANIDEGIARSIADHSAHIMVKVWLKKTHLHDAKEIDMILNEYLSSGYLSRTVSSKEYVDLVNEYIPVVEAYDERHKSDIEAENELQAASTEHAVASIALKASASSAKFESGQRTYSDWQSAAAHDDLLFADENDK